MSAFLRLLLRHGPQTRSDLVLAARAQDGCVITLFNSSWLIQPSFLLVFSSHGGRSHGETRCSSSSVRRRPSVSPSDSVEVGEAQIIERVWEEYFAEPSHWWDNRVHKKNPDSPDFSHKGTKRALWANASSTPTWVKAMLKLVTQSTLPSPVGYHTTDSQEILQSNRLPISGRRANLPSTAKESNQPVQGGAGDVLMGSSQTTSEAMDVLKNRQQLGVATDSSKYVEILKRCLKEEDLPAVKQVHECLIERRTQQNVYLENNLLSAYTRCGSLEDATRVFDGLVKKDVITWNVMIGGYARHSRAKAAMEIFNQMRQTGVLPNEVTYLNVLKACASPCALKFGRELHAYIRRAGYGSDVRVGTTLLKMYANCGSIKEARKTFDSLPTRNVVSWNVMIGAYADSGCGAEAYRLLLQMKREGFTPDAVTYTSILTACASTNEALDWVKEVHGHIRDAGLVPDLRLGSALVHMYAKCGSIDAARLVFDRMAKRNVVTWNVIISAYAERGCGEEAYELFLQMKREGLKPEAITYMNLLNASASAGALKWVKEVHNHARGDEAAAMADVRVGNALVHMYAKCGSVDDSRLVFEAMQQRSVVTWNVMIGAYAESGRGEEAFGLFLQMRRDGFAPDAVTYVNMLNACANAGALNWVEDVHSHVREAGLESDVRVGNALIYMYAKCGSIADARRAFDGMKERDVVTWNVMISGLAQHGRGVEALEVFREMNAAGVKPDGYSFVAVLSACSHAGLVAEGRRLFLAMDGVVPTVLHWNCMVDLLGRAGRLQEAKLFIDRMPVAPDAATWGALLSACRSYGNVELGELAAMERVKLEPNNASTYVLLSNIYAAAEKWEKVSLVRTMMQERGIHKEQGRSWITVENKVHAFAGGSTSHPQSKEIYAELSRLTEEIKAEGYFPETRLVLHDIDEKEKELSLCSHSEKLAIAYGLICTPSRSRAVIRVYKNLRVCSDCHTATKLISKVSRKEIVVRDANRFHHFKDGLCSCNDYW